MKNNLKIKGKSLDTYMSFALSLIHKSFRDMKIQNANDLKPSANEISHIQALMFNEKYGKKMVHQFSVYLSNGQYHLAEGMIFNERQNHKVLMSNKNYNVIAKFLGA